MNYAGKFDTAISLHGPGGPSHSYLHTDSFASHAPADAIIVPDADLLFGGDFKRLGADLVLSKDGREHVVHNYFRGDKHVALASPDGAHLTGDIVDALTGEVQVSQAAGDASAHQVIGHVTKLAGSATAIRNGVSIILNMGDNVEKGDVVQSGANSTLGITFIDGTVFGLSSNARMVLNEMVYDPNGSNNSSLLSLVAGTITFVAGQTAKHGDMKVDTPVATMGIRGTAVLVEIDFAIPGQNGAPNASFQVLVEPDGTTGSYVLFDKTTLQPIAVVNQAGQQINFNNGVISQTNSPLPPDVQKLIQDVFQQKFTDNSNTKSTSPFNDSTIPHSDNIIIKLADGSTATATFQINFASNTQTFAPDGTINTLVHVPGPPTAVVLDPTGNLTTTFSFSELVGKTGDAADQDIVIGRVNFVDVNAGDLPTVKIDFSSFTYQDAAHNDVTTKLSALQLADVVATEIRIAVTPAAGNKNNGSATFTYSVADNAFDFLAAGETLTLTYMVRVDTNYAPDNESTLIPITITVVGTNDSPVITSGPAKIAFFGGTSIPGGPLNSADATSGTLSFGDADLTDTHKVSAKLKSAVLSGGGTVPPGPEKIFEKALTASLAIDSTGTGSGTIDWSLAPLPAYVADFIPYGQTLTLTYWVMVTDSQGVSEKQTVTVTITGTDNPAVVWIATGGSGGLWSGAANWETDTAPTANDDVFIITDQLRGLTPSFPVTIDAPAFAKSVTMNDYSDPLGSGRVPELDNLSMLTIGGKLMLSADSMLHNSGTISVGGLAEFLDRSVLSNSGTLMLQGGGDFGDTSRITNTGTIELSGGTLNVLADVNNHCGTFIVDDGATLALNAGTIDGGKIVVHCTLDLASASVLQDGTLINCGWITVSGSGNALHAETVKANLSLEILSGGALTIDKGSHVDNAGGTITVDHSATLTLNDASIDSGTVAIDGAPMSEAISEDADGPQAQGGVMALTGSSTLSNGDLVNDGTIDVSGVGNALHNENVTANLTLEVLSGGALTIDKGSKVDNTGGTITVDHAATLTLNDASVDSGTVTVDGAPTTIMFAAVSEEANGPQAQGGVLALTGSSTLSNGNLVNDGTIDVSGSGNALHDENVTTNLLLEILSGGELTVDKGSKVDNTGGTITVDHSATLVLNEATVDHGKIVNESGGEIDITGSTAIKDGKLANDGTVEVSGSGNALHHETVFNSNEFEILASGALLLDCGTVFHNGCGTLTIDGHGTLTLDDATISGGAIVNESGATPIGGTIDVIGSSTINGNATLSGGYVTVAGGAVLTLDNVTVTCAIVTLETADASVKVEDTLALDHTSVSGGSIDNHGTIEVTGSSSIVDDLLNNVCGVIQVDYGRTLTLDDTSVRGGEIVDKGSVKVDTGATLTLEDGVTVTGGGQLINSGTIDIETVAGAVFDGVAIDNGTAGTIQVDDDGPLPAPATLTLEGGASITHGSLHIGLSGELDVATACGATLSDVCVANCGTIYIDGCAALTLDDTEIVGGIITDHGAIRITGDSAIDYAYLAAGTITVDCNVTLTLDGTTIVGGTIYDHGTVTIEATDTLTLDGVTVHGGEFDNWGTLTIKGVTVIDDDSFHNYGKLIVDYGAELILNGTVITGGTVINDGTIDSTGGGEIDEASIINNGVIESTAGTMVIDPMAPTTLTNNASGFIEANGAELDIVREDIRNSGSLEAVGGGTLKLSDLTVSNSHGDVTIDHLSELDLDCTTISGGSVDNAGDLDSSGDSAINGAMVDNGGGTIDVLCGTLTLDNTTINHGVIVDEGTINVDDRKTLKLGGVTLRGGGTIDNDGTIEITRSGSIEEVAIANFGGLLLIDSGQTLALDGATIKGGNVADFGVADIDWGCTLTLGGVAWNGGRTDNDGMIHITGSSSINRDWLDNHQLTIDGNVTLTLDGTTINGGTVTDCGTINVDAFSSLELNGVRLNGGGTIHNAGVIEISDSSSIDGESIINTRGATLVVDTHETLTLDDSAVTGGSMLVGGTVAVEAGHALTLHDVNVLGGGGNTLANAGLIHTEGSTELNGFGSVVNNGTIEVDSGSLEIGEKVVSTGNATGTFVIGHQATLELGSSVSSSQTIAFTDKTGTLVLDDAHDFKATIKGFTGDNPEHSDQIDLAQFDYSSLHVTEQQSGDVFTMMLRDARGHSATLTFEGHYQSGNFVFESDHHGGTLIVDPPVGANASGGGTSPALDTDKAHTNGIDAFVFNFAKDPPAPVDFNQLRDGLHFTNPPPVTPPQAGGQTEQDAGIVGPASDGQDVTGWSGLLKAQIHHTDFHV